MRIKSFLIKSFLLAWLFLLLLSLGAFGARVALAAGPYTAAADLYAPVNGTLVPGFGRPVQTAFGQRSEVIVPDAAASFAAGGSFTVEGRVRLTAPGASQVTLIDHGTGDTGSYQLFTDTAAVYFDVQTASGRVRASVYFGNLADGNWHSFAGVFVSGTRCTVYCDSLSSTTATTYTYAPGTAAGTWIGKGTATDATNIYQGVAAASFAEVAFSGVAQYPAAARKLATSRFFNDRAGQVAIYHFDGNLLDSSTNADFTSIGGGGPTGPAPQIVTALWGQGHLPYWYRVYNVLTDPHLPAHLIADGDGATPTDNLPNYASIATWVNTHGGGVLYFPSGKYYFSTTTTAGIALPSGVYLEGDGHDPVTDLDLTTLTFNSAGIADARGVTLTNCTGCGLYNIALQYLGPTETGQPPNTDGTNVGQNLKVFGIVSGVLLSRVHWLMGAGQEINFYGNGSPTQYHTNVAVEDSRFESASNYAAFNWNWISGLEIARCRFFYKESYFFVNSDLSVTLSGVSLYRTGGKPVAYAVGGTNDLHTVDGGGFELSFCKDLLMDACSCETLGTLYRSNNDGGCLSTQFGGATYFGDTGTATSYAGGILTDTAKSWSQNWDPRSRLMVTSGRALGAVRPILSHTANTLTVASMSPGLAPGDTYVVVVLAGEDITVQNCAFVNNPIGPYISQGNSNVKVINNTIINCQGISLDAYDLPNQHGPVFGCDVHGNYVSDPNNERYSYVGEFAIREVAGHGGVTLLYGNKVYGNRIVAHTPGIEIGIEPFIGVTGDGVYALAQGAYADPASIADVLPGRTNGVGPIPAAASATGPATGPQVAAAAQPGAYNLGNMPTTRAAAAAIIKTVGYVVYRGRTYYNAADLPAEFN